MKVIPSKRFFLIAMATWPLLWFSEAGFVASILTSTLVAALVLLGISAVLASQSLPEIRRLRWPERAHVGRSTSVVLQLSNHGPFKARYVVDLGHDDSMVAVEEAAHVVIGGQRRAEVALQVRGVERGETEIGPVKVRVSGPFGLAWRQIERLEPTSLRVWPTFAHWKQSELALRRVLQAQGQHRYRFRGAGTLFQSLREYNPSDDIRWVDWRATARLGRAISRNYEEERNQTLMLLLDASRLMTTVCDSRTKFDAALEAAVLMASSATRMGEKVGLCLFSDEVETFLPPKSHPSRLGEMVGCLYDRFPSLVEPSFERAFLRTCQGQHRRMFICVLTDISRRETNARLQRAIAAAGRRHQTIVCCIDDPVLTELERSVPDSAEEMYTVGIANEIAHDRDLVVAALKQRGTQVVRVAADQLGPAALDTYLKLKRRGR